jgi:hypothetical protein
MGVELLALHTYCGFEPQKSFKTRHNPAVFDKARLSVASGGFDLAQLTFTDPVGALAEI